MIHGRLAFTIVLTVLAGSCRAAQKNNSQPESVMTDPGWVATAEYRPPEHLRLHFDPPSAWIVETTPMSGHWAQYRLPSAAKDIEPATVIVDWFGPIGRGDDQSNLERWVKMFESSRDTESGKLYWDSSMASCGKYTDPEGNEGEWCQIISEIELRGTYLGDPPSDRGSRTRKERWCLIAAIHDGKRESGPYYLQLLGPATEVDRWRESFQSFLEGARPNSAPRQEAPSRLKGASRSTTIPPPFSRTGWQ